eukprot:766063-Hanusia_phi.AAC.2
MGRQRCSVASDTVIDLLPEAGIAHIRARGDEPIVGSDQFSVRGVSWQYVIARLATRVSLEISRSAFDRP